MVDNHVGNGSNAIVFESLDERTQFLLSTERRVVVAEPIEIVVAHRLSAAVGTLWQPY